jgi:hypothetical protein
MEQGRIQRLAMVAAALAVFWGQYAQAAPQVGYAFPAGGQRGTTVVVEVGGQALRGVDGARVSGAGVRAEVLEYVRALDNQELWRSGRFLQDLVRRRWSAKVMESAGRDAGEPALPDHPWLRDIEAMSPAELDRLRSRLFDPKRQPNAQIAEQVLLAVRIAADAPAGDRELRLASPDGLSNPLCFQVGLLPEVLEQDSSAGPTGTLLETPVLLNGQIAPGQTDRFRLRLRQGQKLVACLHARRLIPYLADAVPGWFQAVMALHGPDGREVAWCDDYRFDPDPVLLYEVPADGTYQVVVHDAIYRGREDFVYRLAIGELPWVSEVFPLGGREGTSATVALQGWNLTSDTLRLDTRPDSALVRSAVIGADQGFLCPVGYAVDALPEIIEAEPNGTLGEAQPVVLPVAINGRIGTPADSDGFRFTGQAGQTLVAEVIARRLGSPLDSLLRLLGPDGQELALNDDCKDPSLGLITHHADSYLRAELPQDGAYQLRIGDTQRQGGSAYAYRLQLRPAQPDYGLRLVPSCVNVRAGQTASVTVHVLRRDGFAGEVEVTLVDAPVGFTLSGARIAAGQTSVAARLGAPREARRQVFPLRLEGRAEIDGTTVRRPVVPAEDMMQAFLWRFLVSRQELLVAVGGARSVPAVWRPLVPGFRLTSDTPVRLPLGGAARVALDAPETLAGSEPTGLAAVRFRLASQPRGVTLRDAAVEGAGVTLTLRADANAALAGDAGHAIIEAYADAAPEDPADPGSVPSGCVSLGVLPAIAIEVVRP